ncbi:hypothetical protein Tco_1080278 [Tanacetum coccineum]|uniref:Uncharacterized protein n=1 Tax=Tanacetum coccineum TaxID=301880 RepID=A0ABQ5HW69_9ASTR
MWQYQAPRHHGGTPAQTRMEQTFELTDNVPSTPYASPLTGGYTPGSDEDSYAGREKVSTDQELLEKMLNLQLEAEEESTMAFELIKFIKSMLECVIKAEGKDGVEPTIEENGVTKTKKYKELSATEKIQADCDLKATNIILQAGSNDMNIYKMNLEQFQVNTKFLNSLPPEWSDDPPVFKQGDDPIDAINKMISFLSTVVTSHFPTTKNQLRNSSNPIQQVAIHEGRVTVQLVQGRQSSFAAGEGHMTRQCPKPKRKRDATWFRDKVLLVEAQGSGKVLNEEELEFLANPGVAEGPVTQTVITHNATYQADDLDAYDSECDDFSTAKAVLMANLSSYRSDVLSEVHHSKNTHNDMLNQSVQEMSYSEQTHLVNYPENEITSDRNIIPYSQFRIQILLHNKIIILSVFEQLSNQVKLLEERQNVDLSTREKLIMDEIIREKNAQFADFEKEINYLKQNLSKHSKEKELLTKTFNVFKNKSKEKEAKNIDKEIALEKKVKEHDNIVCKMGQSVQTMHMLMKPQVFYDNNLKQALGFQNPFYLKKAQHIRPMLYDGSVIAKETNVISIADFEETLMLEEESRSKMLLIQSDPMVLEKKVNIKPINYAELNRLSEDFGKRFIPQQELFDEQAFWLQISHPNTDQSASSPVKIEAPRELPKDAIKSGFGGNDESEKIAGNTFYRTT